MSQYDAGPGDLSDREWESPDKQSQPHARRRRVTLPPWALIVILVAIIILLCVSLVLIVRAIRGEGDEGTPTPQPTLTLAVTPTNTPRSVAPTSAITPTETVTLPIEPPEATATPDGIAPGTMVLVHGTQGAGLNLREKPTTYAKVVGNAKEGTVLKALEGPRESDGYVWWRLQAPDGAEGWAAENWLALKTE